MSTIINEAAPDAPDLAELSEGLHRDIPMRAYLALPYMSASRLLKLDRSPLQYQYALTAPPETTDALERGTALHMAILEGHLFESHYAVAEPCGILLKSGPRAGQPCSVRGLFLHRELGWLCGTHVKNLGDGLDTSREVLSADNHAKVVGMRDAILSHARARTLFSGAGEFEATVVWRDEKTGIVCKARPDRLVRRAGMLVDIKSSRTAHPREFPAIAERLGYFAKLAFYRRALRAIDWPYANTAVLAIEPEPPYDLAPYLVDDTSLDTAELEIERLLRLYAHCRDENTWPGYARSDDGFLNLSRPAWAGGSSDEAL